MVKWHADAALDVRAARWKHETMPGKTDTRRPPASKGVRVARGWRWSHGGLRAADCGQPEPSIRGDAAEGCRCRGCLPACAGKKGDASLDSFYPILRHHPQMQQVETYAQARQPPTPPASTTLRWLLLALAMPSRLADFRSSSLAATFCYAC